MFACKTCLHRAQLLGLLAGILVFICRVTEAQKYNLTSAVASTLVADHVPPGVSCDEPGICFPVNVTIPGRSLWYWCGFYATHRTIYTAKSVLGTNFTTMYLMRQNQLLSCALPNLTWVGDSCSTIPESSCSSKSSCNVRVFGLVFPDDVCFVIINNRNSNTTATIQLNNFYDRPRYYGTCFVLFFTIVGGLAILANVSWQFYNIIIAPVGRHTEPVKVKREEEETDTERAASTVALTGGSSHVTSGRPWYTRVVAKLKAHMSHSDHEM